jgi:hypothetical protein
MGGTFGNFGGSQLGFAGGGPPVGSFGHRTGYLGAGGACGMYGIGGFGGCFGSFPCSFGGCFGSFPCSFGGCFGGISGTPQQFYGAWNKFPLRSYYHRDLYVANPFAYQSLTVIHYPDRPNYFYFYDPAQKKYVGRYRRGAKDQDCFAMLAPNFRKATLGEVAEKSFSKWGPMPAIAQLTAPAVASSAAPMPALGTPPQLVRPPDTLPGHDLPPDEFLEKEK